MSQYASDIATLMAALAALMGSIAAVIVAVKGRKDTRAEIREIHLSMNSRLDELLKLTKREAHAAGLQEGRDERQ